MPELQHPDIVGNFLSSYGTAQQKQQADADRQRNMQRQDQGDEMARQAHALKIGQEVVDMLGSVGDGDVAGFERAKQRWAQMGLPPEAVAGFTAADLPMLRQKAGTQLRELQLKNAQLAPQLTQAQINEVRARTAKVNADARAQSNPPPSQYQNLTVGGSSTVAAPNPYANLSDDAARNRLYLQEMKANEKIREDARAAAMQAQGKIAKVEAFRKMNKETGTGGVYSGPILPGVFQGMGRIVDSNIPNMEAISAELAINTRPPGSGAPSNYDAQMFERATVGIDKPGPANANIAKAISEQAKRDIGYSKFVDWYFQTHKTNQGIDQAWQEYADSNPIFDPRSPSAFKLNDRSVNWDQWFGLRKPSGGATPAATGATAAKKITTLPNGVTIEELD